MQSGIHAPTEGAEEQQVATARLGLHQFMAFSATDVKAKKSYSVSVSVNESYLATLCSALLDMGANRVELLKGLIVLEAKEIKT